MDPHPMDHMPPSLMPTIPNILSSAYASRLDWIRNRGVRPAPPTPPPVVTPSGEPGPGRLPERPWEFAPAGLGYSVGVRKGHALTEEERKGMTTEEIKAYNDGLEALGGPVEVKLPTAAQIAKMKGAEVRQLQAQRDAEEEARQAYERERGWELPPGLLSGGTVSIPMPWSWPPERVPQSAQEREEKAGYDQGLAAGEAGIIENGEVGTQEQIEDLLKRLQAGIGSKDVTNAENAWLQGWLDGLWRLLAEKRKVAAQAPKAPAAAAGTPGQAPTAAAAPKVGGWVIGHKLQWPNVQPPLKDDRKIVAFLRQLAIPYGLPGGAGEYLKFARAVWNAVTADNAFLADDLLADALANSNPDFAGILKQIRDFADEAQPEALTQEGRARQERRGTR